METKGTMKELVDLDKVNVEACEPTKLAEYTELSLGTSLRLHVAITEDTVSVVVAEPTEKQASIVVDETNNWMLKQD